MTMTREGGEAFAAQWADAWNRRDIEAVLEHFSNDVAFTSPTALTITGKPAILYTSDLNDTVKRVSESLAFNDEGLVASAEVLHGIGGN